MFACFTLAFAIAIGRATTERGWRWPMLAGIAAGLAAATKETAVIVLPASLAACALAWWSLGSDAVLRRAGERRMAESRDRQPRDRRGRSRRSSTRRSSRIRVASSSRLRAAATYFQRGVDPAGHVHPWHYYLGAPRLVIVRRPGVDRGVRARPRRRRRSDGVDPARSVEPRSGVLAPISHRHRRAHSGDLLRHPVQDALEPPPLLRRDDRRRRNRRLGARAGDGVPRGSRLPGWRGRDRLALTWDGRRGGRRSSTPRIRAIRTSTRRRSPMPSAWPRASAIWPPCTARASACW